MESQKIYLESLIKYGMRPFALYHKCADSITLQQQKLTDIISQIAAPDMIYLLGASLHRRRSESIFCSEAPSSQHTADYYLLVLLSDFNNREQFEWQDMIEQHCSGLMPVTTIVLKTATFKEWLLAGHGFARHVVDLAPCIYQAGHIVPVALLSNTATADPVKKNKIYTEGLNRANEFFAGAEVFKLRKQYAMAAFMLHQSAEQVLRTILIAGTGYNSCTHNLDRLSRYAGMVAYQLPDIFSKRSGKDGHLFRVLQTAYSDTRYKEGFQINSQDLLLLINKVSLLLELLIDFGKSNHAK